MEFLKRSWAQAQSLLEQLDGPKRWLVILCLAWLITVLVVVAWWTQQPEWVPVEQFAADQRAEVVQQFSDEGIRYKIEGSQLFVPAGRQLDAIAALQRNELMAPDTSQAFDELVRNQNVWDSTENNRVKFLIAKQKVLASIVRKMPGVRSADVVLSKPEKTGFGETHIVPTASVNVVMQGSQSPGKSMVKAVAGLVSRANAPMKPQDVSVIVDGREYTVKDPQSAMPEETLALVQMHEDYYQDKIARFLKRFIPSASVAVNIQLDPVHREESVSWQYDETEPLASEHTLEKDRRNVRDAGSPGVQSNVGTSIEPATAMGTTETVNETEARFGPKNLTGERRQVIAGRTVQQINATISIPRSHFVTLYKMQAGEEAGDPDEAALQPIIADTLKKIEEQVQPMVATQTASGLVVARMVNDPGSMMAALGQTEASSSAGVLAMLESGWAKPIGLSLLALLGLGVMFNMVRKATQQETLPSVEELAGVPPTLQADEELVGEVEGADLGMAGVEVGEDELRVRKVAQQISDMIKANPEEAIGLVNKWLIHDD